MGILPTLFFSRHPSFWEVLSIFSMSSLSPGHVLPARAGEHDVEDWPCREQWGQVWKKHITCHWNGCRWSGPMVSLAFWFSCFLFNGFVTVLWMVSNLCLEDTDYAESHLPGLYFYLSVDLGRTTNKYSESRRVFCSFAGSKNPLWFDPSLAPKHRCLRRDYCEHSAWPSWRTARCGGSQCGWWHILDSKSGHWLFRQHGGHWLLHSSKGQRFYYWD